MKVLSHLIGRRFTCVLIILVVNENSQKVFGVELSHSRENNSSLPPIPTLPPNPTLPPTLRAVPTKNEIGSLKPVILDASFENENTVKLELDVKRITTKIIEIAHSTQEDYPCIQETEEHITEAIENIRRRDWDAAKQRLVLVEEEYTKAFNSTPRKPFCICDRALLHTCHPIKNTCGCSENENEMSTSAAQRINTGHRYLWKDGIKSYYCYASTGLCDADPTQTIISLFEEQYQSVYEHYGNPNVDGNHKDTYKCLKNLCAAFNEDHTECTEDTNKNKIGTLLSARYMSRNRRMENIKRIYNKMKNSGFQGKKSIRERWSEEKFPTKNWHEISGLAKSSREVMASIGTTTVNMKSFPGKL